MLRVADTVIFTSPLLPTLPVVVDTAKGSALYVVILPVVRLAEESVTTCNRPETNQFCKIVWSASAEATSMVKLCDSPSVNKGMKGETSRKYVGKSRAP